MGAADSRWRQCFSRRGTADAADHVAADPLPSETANVAALEESKSGGRNVGTKVAKAMDRMGKQRPSGGFSSEEGRISMPPEAVGNVLRSLSAQTLKEGTSWPKTVTGIYEHQALKVGLRSLDEAWAGSGLADFPIGKDALVKESLLRSLLFGEVHLKSLPGSDLVAAQGDLQRLSLGQLLRLRVLLLDFTPSGAGGGGVSAFNFQASHETFLRMLDGLVFARLGEKIRGGGVQCDADTADLGRDSALMVAAATAISSPSWWCWWLPMEKSRRVFFDASKFQISESFPAGGVLEADKRSKVDRNETTGNLRQMDWQVRHVMSAADLRTDSPVRRKSSGLADVVSAEALQDGRSRLRSGSH